MSTAFREQARPRVLYVVHRLPYPPDKGDRIRAFQILRWLSRKAEVDLACLADEPVEAGTMEELGRYAARVAVVPLGGWGRWVRVLGSLLCGRTATQGAFASPGLAALLEEWGRETTYHACLASASSVAPYLRLPALRATPAVVDLVDVDSQKWFDYTSASWPPRSWLYGLEGHRLRRLEQEILSWAQGVVLSSAAEAALFRGFAVGGAVHAVGNGVDLDYFQPGPEVAEPRCVFVGALDYRPNVDGVCWFCQEVWPLVIRRRPEARLALVGRRPAAAVRRLASLPGVELVGQVPDVRPYLRQAAVAVVPLRIARGVQNKVLEALAAGRATVASPGALAGVPAVPGEHLLAASSPDDWVDSLERLVREPDLRRELGTAGRRYVEARHRWEQCLHPLGSILGLDDSTAAAGGGEWIERRAGA
jgi:sugar transferase (PEP-CTERM/EpsH1 system associated)